ncbi:energy transducer TonB [Pendulispora brunnea]|uniref:Energy transducer TonB n=1 Tax=Pendulispora brunnea TaxID=2905690 RepID=A0ABZ2KBQ5_9BACT
MGTEKSSHRAAALVFAAASAACAGETATAPPPTSRPWACLAKAPPHPKPRTESGEEIPPNEITPPRLIPSPPGPPRVMKSILPSSLPEGPVYLAARCTIHTDGTVSDCSMICSHPAYDAVTLEGLSIQRYEPATYRGRPIELVYTFTYRVLGP